MPGMPGSLGLAPAAPPVFYNMLPLYGALLGFLFLGESIGIPHIIGGVLIVGGGVWARPEIALPRPQFVRPEAGSFR